ncbi:cell surface glycoprotein 1-like isoform X1 [Pseudopipra pipra]|uniref:cell surface glycoprotein 1-like isoform X1 n=1 Tax=Pseudopipra pipra TaxID=415032 RepID=UPI003139ADFD
MERFRKEAGEQHQRRRKNSSTWWEAGGGGYSTAQSLRITLRRCGRHGRVSAGVVLLIPQPGTHCGAPGGALDSIPSQMWSVVTTHHPSPFSHSLHIVCLLRFSFLGVGFSGSSWLSLPVPQPSEAEHNPKKPMSSSEPILDLKTDTAEAAPAHSNPEEPQPRPGTRQDPANSSSGNAVATSSHEEPIPPPTMAETLPGTDTEAEEKNPSPTNSLPWPEAPEECPARGPEECPVRAPEECPARAPEECPARPNTLDFSKSLKKLEEVKQAGQRRNSDQVVVKENGVEVSPAALPVLSEERKALESELGKCIEEFRKIKIPVAFPNKKRQWQSELLKKYQL